MFRQHNAQLFTLFQVFDQLLKKRLHAFHAAYVVAGVLRAIDAVGVGKGSDHGGLPSEHLVYRIAVLPVLNIFFYIAVHHLKIIIRQAGHVVQLFVIHRIFKLLIIFFAKPNDVDLCFIAQVVPLVIIFLDAQLCLEQRHHVYHFVEVGLVDFIGFFGIALCAFFAVGAGEESSGES